MSDGGIFLISWSVSFQFPPSGPVATKVDWTLDGYERTRYERTWPEPTPPTPDVGGVADAARIGA